MKQVLSITLIAVLLTSCFGDKKLADVSEMNDTTFVNTNFKGNRINYAEGMSACDKISAQDIASLYGVSADLIHFEDPTKSDRYRKDTPPVCGLYIKTGANDYQWLRGSVAVNREIGKDEQMGEIAEAAGAGEKWEEAWALKKSISQSSEWIPNMGKAALWNARKKVLEIKFEGYTLVVNPLSNILNSAEKEQNRDYKKIAIALAKAGGYIN